MERWARGPDDAIGAAELDSAELADDFVSASDGGPPSAELEARPDVELHDASSAAHASAARGPEARFTPHGSCEPWIRDAPKEWTTAL
jgi:hypothetical protein